MPIYESVGFGNDLHLNDNKPPFDYIANFRTRIVPQGSNIDDFKRNLAPYLYCWLCETRRERQL